MAPADRTDLLHGQFLLCQTEAHVPPAWNRSLRQGWIVASHPSLPVIDIEASDGTFLGYLLGYPITPDGVFCPPRLTIPQYAASSPAALEGALYDLGGRFLAIILTPLDARLYLDAGGTLPVVYSLQEPMAGSSPSLFNTTDYPWDTGLMQALSMPASGLWYPFGLTPRRAVQRLLPNHYLDLTSWQAVRHWPLEPALAATGSLDEHINTIITALQRTFASIAHKTGLHLSLTAGRDSRLLLACAHQQVSDILFFTFTRRRITADSHIAQKIARRWNLQHSFLPVEHATADQLDLWQYQTGACVSGDIWHIHPTLRHLDKSRALLPGAAGEVGRAYYATELDDSTLNLTSDQLVSRCHLPAAAPLVNAAQSWLDQIADRDPLLILDLLYLEQRVGCWASPQQLGTDPFVQYQLMPFAQRAVTEAMLRLPFEYRRRQQLVEDVCQRVWPELLELPFNDYAGLLRHPAHFARAMFQTARKVRAKLRSR